MPWHRDHTGNRKSQIPVLPVLGTERVLRSDKQPPSLLLTLAGTQVCAVMRQSLKMVRNGVVGGVFVCCAVLLLHGWGGENQARTTALEGGGTTYVTPGKYDSSLADMMGELTQNSLHAKQEVHAETMVSAGQEGTASSLKSAMVHILRDLGDDVDFDQDGDEVPGAKKLSRDQVEDLLESADDARAAVKNAARSLRLLQERQRAVRAKAQQLIEGLRSKMEALDTHNGEIGGRITKVGEMRGPEGPKGVSGLPGPDGPPPPLSPPCILESIPKIPAAAQNCARGGAC